MESYRNIDLNRLSVLAGGLLLPLAILRFLEIPSQPLIRATVLGSPLGLNLTATSLMMLIILGLTISAVSSLISTHPFTQHGDIQYRVMFWIVPALLNLALASLLNRIPDPRVWALVSLACAVIVPSGLIIEYDAVDQNKSETYLPMWVQELLIYLAAIIIFTLIYDARVRSLLSATAVSLVATLLSIRLFWRNQIPISRSLQYGGITGLILGQLTWGLNYLRMSGLQGGLFLLLVFYVVMGIIQQFIQGQFDDKQNSRRILLEYGVVATVTLFLILFAAL